MRLKQFLRPITPHEEHFYTVMMHHYQERMHALPYVYFLRNTYNCFKTIVNTKMIASEAKE